MTIIIKSLSLILISLNLCALEFQLAPVKDDGEESDGDIFIVRDSDIVSSELVHGDGYNGVMVHLTDECALKNYKFTSERKGKKYKFVANGIYLSTPRVIMPSNKSFVVTTSIEKIDLNQFIKSLNK